MCSPSVGYGNPPNSAPVFIAWSPLLSFPVTLLNTFSSCSAMFSGSPLALSLSLSLVCHPFVVLFDLWRAQAQAPHSTRRPVPGYSSNMPVNYIIMQSQRAPWAASTCHCVCVGVCGSSDIVPELFENNDKSGIQFWMLYEYYVRIYIHKLVKWVQSELIKQAAKWLNNMNTLMWMVI